MASPDYIESNYTDKPNDTTTTWAISVTNTSCLQFTKLCLDSNRRWQLALLSKQNTETFAITQKHYCSIETFDALNNFQQSLDDKMIIKQAKYVIDWKNVVSLFSYDIVQHITAQILTSCVDYIN